VLTEDNKQKAKKRLKTSEIGLESATVLFFLLDGTAF
jgi:hypothetical protein